MAAISPERLGELVTRYERGIDKYHLEAPEFYPQEAVDLQKSLFRRFVQIKPDECNEDNARVSAAIALKYIRRKGIEIIKGDIAILYGESGQILMDREVYFLQTIGWVIEPLHPVEDSDDDSI